MSLRAKLILVVVLIVFVSFATLVVTNMRLLTEDKQQSLLQSNRRISGLVSRFVMGQVGEYRRDLQNIFNAWKSDESFQLSENFFPDLIWLEIIDWNGNSVYEWSHDTLLFENNLSSRRLMGKRNRDSLFSEVKQVFSRNDQWLMLNSTVDPFLPSFLLATPLSNEKNEAGVRFVVLAEFRADPLIRQISSREGQKLYLIDSHRNILVSTAESWDASQFVFDHPESLEILANIEFGEEQSRLLEFGKKGKQLTFFKKFSEGKGISLILQEPYTELLAAQKRIQIQSSIVAFIVLIFVINIIIFMAHRFTGPLKRLTGLMKKVGKGQFKGSVKVDSNDEIGQLAKVFNKMLQDLVAREEEVGRAKQKLIQSEKMSAFGQMSAGIAHEVKNPLAGILGYAQMAKKKLEDRPELMNYMAIIEKETTRCKEIVENLMKFARQEKASLQKIDINKTVQDSLRLVEHQITVAGVKINQAFAQEGKPIFINGNANQIQQVMLNLMLNAQHAMENKGTLSVSTHYDETQQKVLILISDTGCGMSQEVMERIFEPFYTTKSVGKGTGLGLSVSLGIIKDHKGDIEVDSAEGRGTTFTINLPAYGPEADAVDESELNSNDAEGADNQEKGAA